MPFDLQMLSFVQNDLEKLTGSKIINNRPVKFDGLINNIYFHGRIISVQHINTVVLAPILV